MCWILIGDHEIMLIEMHCKKGQLIMLSDTFIAWFMKAAGAFSSRGESTTSFILPHPAGTFKVSKEKIKF